MSSENGDSDAIQKLGGVKRYSSLASPEKTKCERRFSCIFNGLCDWVQVFPESSRVVCKPFLADLAWDGNVVLLEWRHHDGNIQQFICGNPVYAMGTLAKHLKPFAHFSTNALFIAFSQGLFHPGQLGIIGFKIGRRIEALVECDGIGNLISPRALLTDGGPAHNQT